jgi:hypothetical protein
MLNVENILEEMDKMTAKEIAKSITQAPSHDSQFLVLAYLSSRPERHDAVYEEVKRLIEKDDKLNGAFLDGYIE